DLVILNSSKPGMEMLEYIVHATPLFFVYWSKQILTN
ncbi:hypothetical protein SAMN05216362_1251, partial [Piscibacillus halophilus]